MYKCTGEFTCQQLLHFRIVDLLDLILLVEALDFGVDIPQPAKPCLFKSNSCSWPRMSLAAGSATVKLIDEVSLMRLIKILINQSIEQRHLSSIKPWE
jgi:hypothetical protein